MAVRGLSIKVKLPLLIGGLLVAVTTIYSGAAYEKMRSSSRAAVTARLATVASQYAQALKTQRDQLVTAARSVAESPAVRAFTAEPRVTGRASAEAALRPVGLQAPQVLAVELWSADRRRLLASGDAGRWSGTLAAIQFLQALAGADSGAVGRFRAVGDTIGYPVGAQVVTGGKTRGYEEVEAFAYSISHDLRSPLRAMEGFSQALLEDYGDRLEETGRAHVERVASAARMMDRLIDDLLAYSRLTRSELDLAPLQLGPLVKASLRQLDADVRSCKARIAVEDPLPTVVAHGPTLEQVLANLLANGIKFVAPGRTPEVRVRAEERDGRVRLWVEDNGIGIAPEHHDRIFRVFERLHRVTVYPGTGIGLAIVRKGMERMGGRSGVESEAGRGSRFWIELPRAK